MGGGGREGGQSSRRWDADPKGGGVLGKRAAGGRGKKSLEEGVAGDGGRWHGKRGTIAETVKDNSTITRRSRL